MTVYGLIENNTFIPATNEPIEILEAKGFRPFNLELVSMYYAGMAIVQDDELVDITNTPEYIDQVKAEKENAIMIELDAKIKELEGTWSSAVIRGEETAEDFNTVRNDLINSYLTKLSEV